MTAESGLDFVHDAGSAGDYFMPRVAGSGAALFDFDGDGLLDIYLVQNGGPAGKANKLYRQRPGGRFEDVTARSGLGVAGWGMGVAVGDVNNDGRPDVLLTGYGGVRLFLNNGDGTFADVTKEAGLDNPHWATAAAFFDYDRDGRLDLVIANYVDYEPGNPCQLMNGRPEFCHPRSFAGTAARLYRNTTGRVPGGRPRFEDVTLASGIGRRLGNGLGVLCADFDGDGWPDIFVANDLLANHLWINRHDGTFAEEAVARGIAYNALGQPQANMGIAAGDVRGLGRLDVFVTHLDSEYNTLWAEGPTRGMFEDRTAATGLATPEWRGTGFGAVLADFDHDGTLDAAVANGAIRRATGPAAGCDDAFWTWYAQRNQLFANDGGGKFHDLSRANPALCGTPGVYRGLACGDLDNDGALDLLVTQVAGPVRLLRNVAPKRGHWLGVRALDPALKRDAYGAVVTVAADGVRRTRLVQPSYSYLCSNDVRAHFGLGAAGRYDAIEVAWPDGTAERFPGGPADRALVLRKGEGQGVRPGPETSDGRRR